MTLWLVVIIASLGCLALKIAGYLVPETFLEKPTPSRIANLLTVALLAALWSRYRRSGAGTEVVLDAREPAVLVAAGLLALRVPFILVVIAAAAVAALLACRRLGLAFEVVDARHPARAGHTPAG